MFDFFRLQNLKNIGRGKEDAAFLSLRYRFLLGAYGFRLLEKKLHRFKYTDRDKPNMHTNRAVGASLTPGAVGQLPVSPLGTPIFSDLILHQQGVSPDTGVQLTNCLIQVEQTKSMVITPISGNAQLANHPLKPIPVSTGPAPTLTTPQAGPMQNGPSWKNLNAKKLVTRTNILEDEYTVTLTGAVVRTFNNDYPQNEVGRLISLLKYGEPLQVLSPYLRQFGINELVIDNYKMAQESGKQNTQTFQIRGYS